MTRLRLAWLYPDLMNMYGDRGNVLTLTQRAAWRGIDAEVVAVGLGEASEIARCNLIFFGGGQDREQALVFQDLDVHKRRALTQAAAAGVPMLAVCGGYQLLSRHYVTAAGERLEGLGLIDAHTVAGATRLIGDVACEADPALGLIPKTLVGFENHSGRTRLGSRSRPLARVLAGQGNNGEDRSEGALCGSLIGTYLHGSLLPKNPHLADWLLRQALGARLKPLDDSLEMAAHRVMLGRALKAG